MGIFKRIWNWLRSLFGGKGRREAAELDRCVRTMQEALLSMKAQTEAVLAAQDKRKREITRCEEELAKMGRYAEKALKEDREEDARFFLEKKASLEKQLADLRSRQAQAAGYTSQAERLYQKAQSQLNEVTARKDAVRAKLAAAELTESLNRLNDGALAAGEAQAQAALDRAEAMAELEGRTADRELEALMSKYDEEKPEETAAQRTAAGTHE